MLRIASRCRATRHALLPPGSANWYVWLVWDFRRLEAWRRTRRLILGAYRATERFPDDERFGLRSQIRRSANSIGANIAEACGREGRDRATFLIYSISSAEELEHHLIISADLEFMPHHTSIGLRRELDQIRRMLKRLHQMTAQPPRNA